MEVDDLGDLVGYGEFWQFTYRRCRHVTHFPRDRSIAGGHDPTWLIGDIREHHRECFECKHPDPLAPTPTEPPRPDPLWFVRDVHADRHHP